MRKLTHASAILLHEACEQNKRRLARVDDGVLAPIGRLGGVEENALDALEVQAWAATARLLRLGDAREAARKLGGHQAAIEEHQSLELLDREAAIEAAQDQVDEVLSR